MFFHPLIDFFFKQLIGELFHRYFTERNQLDGKIAGQQRDKRGNNDNGRQNLVHTDAAGLEGEYLRIARQPGESDGYSHHCGHGYGIKKNIGKEIGEEPDKIGAADIEFQNKIEKRDELDQKKDTVHYDETCKKRRKHFRCQITIEESRCFEVCCHCCKRCREPIKYS